jgi:hypothetical protein
MNSERHPSASIACAVRILTVLQRLPGPLGGTTPLVVTLLIMAAGDKRVPSYYLIASSVISLWCV